MKNPLLKKNPDAVFIQDPVKNVCTKFKVNSSSYFGTGAREMFITHTPLPGEIPPTNKNSKSNSL